MDELVYREIREFNLENRNFKGEPSQPAKASAKIEAYRPEHWGLAVDHLSNSLQSHLGVHSTGWRDGADGVEIPARPGIQFASRNHQDNVKMRRHRNGDSNH